MVVLPEEELLSLQPAGVDPQLADDPVHALLGLERRRVFGEQEVDLRAEPRRRPERPERVLHERPRVFEAAADSATPAIAKVLGFEISMMKCLCGLFQKDSNSKKRFVYQNFAESPDIFDEVRFKIPNAKIKLHCSLKFRNY